MKAEQVYASLYSGRQWKKLPDSSLVTRGDFPGETWKPTGWPQPSMEEKDVDYYINNGDFVEIE